MPTISEDNLTSTPEEIDMKLIKMNFQNSPENDNVLSNDAPLNDGRNSRSLTVESELSDFDNDVNHMNLSRNISTILGNTNPDFTHQADSDELDGVAPPNDQSSSTNQNKNRIFFGENTDLTHLSISDSFSASNFRRRRLTNATQGNFAPHTPMFQIQKRVFRSNEIGDEPVVPLPFGNRIVGTFSCHGIEPSHSFAQQSFVAKTNQDRGAVVYPFVGDFNQAMFMVFDGHGELGDKVSEFCMYEIPKFMEQHEKLETDIVTAFKDAYVAVDRKLINQPKIEPMYSGSTAVSAIVKDRDIWIANAGDSRCTMATLEDNYGDISKSGRVNKRLIAKDLSVDQNPDSPEEMKRIIEMGGFVSPRPEPGLSARVWLDEDFTQVGLAMARSIGDHAVKGIGVIAEPEVIHHRFTNNDKFLIFASDGVWEFISSQEAVEIVAQHLMFDQDDDENDYMDDGEIVDDDSKEFDEEKKEESKEERNRNEKYRCNVACQKLIEVAAQRWRDEEGDYRDDITCFVVRIPPLLQRTCKEYPKDSTQEEHSPIKSGLNGN